MKKPDHRVGITQRQKLTGCRVIRLVPIDPRRHRPRLLERVELRGRELAREGGFGRRNTPHQSGLTDDVAGMIFERHAGTVSAGLSPVTKPIANSQ